jgi:hypothetical protein
LFVARSAFALCNRKRRQLLALLKFQRAGRFEVKDVDAEYERAQRQGLPIDLALRDEPFGQRHFITHDPNGIVIDIIKPIPPSPEYLAQFTVGSAPA